MYRKLWIGAMIGVLMVSLAHFTAVGAAGEDITVGTAEELLAALGSNRRILLKEGEYNLTAGSPGFQRSSNVYFEECYDGPELILKDVHNLTIQGAGDTQSQIVVEPRYASVMSFLNCSNISIVNISAGHTEAGTCTGGVFLIEGSSGIQIDGTAMYGCGTIGLCLYQAKDVKVTNSTIYGCTSRIMEVCNSSDILFADCVFRDNSGGDMVVVETVSGFTMDSCSFLRNSSRYYLFNIWEVKNGVIKNTEFIDNDAVALAVQDDSGFAFDPSNLLKDNFFEDEFYS